MGCFKFGLLRTISMIWQSVAKYSAVAVIPGLRITIYANIW
jgi:hypothetical protein